MNVDNLAGAAKTRQLLDTNVEMCNDIAKFFGKGTCRVRFMLSPMMDAGHEFTMSRAHLYDKSLIEVINIARRSLDEELIAAKNKDTFDELRDDFKFMDDLRRRLAERDAEPHLVSVFVHVDDSAENTKRLTLTDGDYDTPPLLLPPVKALISALTERGPYPVLPRALTVSITNKRLEEVLSAPRCLLVAVDPGARHEVFAIDENARETPLVDFALKVMLGRDAVEALTDDARDAHLKRVRQTAAVAVSTFQDADTTDGGHKRRADILAELRTGKLKLRDVETINAIDATLGDATDAKAPFVFLHVSGCAHLHEVETRATLSVRDSCGRKVVTVDGVFQSLGMEPPVSLKGLLNLLMQSAQLRTSKGVRNREIDESYSLALQEWMNEPTTVVHVSVNGAPPRELRTTKEIAIVEGENAARVTAFLDNRVDPKTGTISLRAKFDNKDGLLVPGTFVSVVIEAQKAQKELVIPQAAIQRNQQGPFVLAVNDKNLVEQRQVELGAQVGSDFVVTKGLQQGERVITLGLQKVRPGVPVKTATDPNAAADAKPAE